MKRANLLVLSILLIGIISADCGSVYEEIISTNWDINETNETLYYINNWAELCQIKENFPSLPDKPNETILYLNPTGGCEINSSFPFDLSIPFFTFHLNEDCNKIKNFKYFFKIEKEIDYKITGIKVAPILFLIIILIVLGLIRN